MADLLVYQIGLGSFGRYGFEKLLEMQRHLDRVDLDFAGVADEDSERLRSARKFAEANGFDIECFESADEAYSHAQDYENVMFYDASPATRHADHLHRSVDNGFFHLAEKPPSMTREEHLIERRLDSAMWKVDFIERESPVVKKAVDLVEGERIDSIRCYRESCIGAEKLVEPVHRKGVVGGDVLDKMSHEIYVYDLLEAAEGGAELELLNAESGSFMPYRHGSDSMMSISGGKSRELDIGSANGKSHAEIEAGDTEVELNSSWLGPSRRSVEEASNLEHDPFSSGVHQLSVPVREEECRFFVMEGSVHLMGDLLHGELIDLESGERIQLPSLMHDQLYRVIRKAVLAASNGGAEDKPGPDSFMTALFDARESALEAASGFHEELVNARQTADELILDAQKFESSRPAEEA